MVLAVSSLNYILLSSKSIDLLAPGTHLVSKSVQIIRVVTFMACKKWRTVYLRMKRY